MWLMYNFTPAPVYRKTLKVLFQMTWVIIVVVVISVVVVILYLH
jgi:hypothetical protein